MSTKRVVVSTEVDMTGNGRLEGLLTTPSPYYDNKDLIDFLSLNNNETAKPVIDNTITFDNINPLRYTIICKLLSKTNEDKTHNFIYDEYEILDAKGFIPNELKNFVNFYYHNNIKIQKLFFLYYMIF